MLIIVVISIVVLVLWLWHQFRTAPHHEAEPSQEVTLRDPGWDHPANCKCRLYHN